MCTTTMLSLYTWNHVSRITISKAVVVTSCVVNVVNSRREIANIQKNITKYTPIHPIIVAVGLMMTNKFEALKGSDDGGDEDNGLRDLQRAEKECQVPLHIPETDHKLQCAYWLWFSRRSPGKQSIQSYDQNLKLIGRFGSVEQFWAIYSHLIRPSELQGHSDFHLFKVGIKPMWEDEANQRGGKWIVRLRKGLASRCWENLVLAMLGEQFMVGGEICGAVVSIRFQEDIISVWNRTASDQNTTGRIRDTLRRVLNLPPNTILEYKTHNDSLKDNSSFRNTDVFTR